MIDPSAIRERFAAVGRGLNERTRRLFAAVEARTAGYGGIAAAAQATGIARSTIGRGLKDLDDPASLSGEVRRPGSGRPALTETDATLLDDLRQLLEPATKGDPMRPLLWVSKSHAKLAAALCTMGHQVSKSTIPKLLELLHYRRQVNRKTLESSSNPDRDAQFEHINTAVIAMQAAGKPVISIDTKKKEPIGPYKNAGSDYRPEGCPEQVKVHDFVDAELGKVVPYGVYDIAANAGCVSVGIDNDTAQFAVNSIRRWLEPDGPGAVPGRRQGDDHRRWRRFQWFARAAVQSRASEAGRRDRTDPASLPLPAGDVEMEQDRASAVLPHHRELAGNAADQPPGGGRAHRRHHDQDRPKGAVRTRHAGLPEGDQGQR